MQRVIKYHNHSIPKALVELFPEINLEKSKFFASSSSSTSMWRDPQKRRKFFENFAKENSFDPIVPENWYKQSKKSIMAREVNFIY